MYIKLLSESRYPPQQSKYLVDGLENAFHIGFHGPRDVVREAMNLRFHTGTKEDLWNKIMKEVQLGHTAGQYTMGQDFPFKYYCENPLGLIPKKGNPNEMQMIVNMSYKDNYSVNYFTKKEDCTVQYNDIDAAVKMIQTIQHKSEEGTVYLAKCDG